MAAFDLSDEYQVHAYLALGFWCTNCGARLIAESIRKVASDEWCVEVASQARSSGWRVPRPERGGAIDAVTAWCPACAMRHSQQ